MPSIPTVPYPGGFQDSPSTATPLSAAAMNALQAVAAGAPQLSGAPADGQLLAYSAALGAWAPVAASGAAELAVAVNVTGTPISLNAQDYGGTTYTPLTGTAITVPASAGRPVTIEWDGLLNQTTSGSGELWVSLNQGSTSVGLSIHPLPEATGVTANGALQYLTFHGAFRVGVLAASTSYSLSAMMYRVSSANTPVAAVLPLAAAPLMVRALAG